MGQDERLRKRYLQRMLAGIFLLAFLAIPAIVHSHAAINTLVNRPIDWVPDTLPEKVAFNELCKRFTVSDAVLVSWPGATLDSENLNDVSAALRQLAPVENDELSEPANDDLIQQIREATGAQHPFLEVRSGADVVNKMSANLSQRAAVARLKGFLIGTDGKQTCLVVTFDEPAHLKRRVLFPLLRKMIAEVAKVDSSDVAIIGGPRDGADVDSESIRSVNVFAPPSAVVAAIICFICLRSVLLTAAITIIAVIGEGLVLAMVYYTGTPMNAVLIVLPPLVFVLTISAGIHLSNYFMDASREFPELSPAAAAQRAVRAGIVPCFLATGTTVIGLSSLILVRIVPIRVFGMVSSIGVTGTLLLLLLVLPGAMVLTRERSEKRKRNTDKNTSRESREEPPQRSRWYNFVRSRLSRPWPVLIFFFMLTSGLAMGLYSLKTSVNLLRMFQVDSPIRNEYRFFEEHIGATSTAELLIQFPTLGENDSPLDRLAVVRAAHLAALQSEPVGGVISAFGFLRSVPSGRSFSASSTRSAIANLIRDENSSLSELGLISRDANSEVWRITLRLWDPEDVDYSVTLATIEQSVQNAVAEVTSKPDFNLARDSVSIVLTGPAVVVHEAQRVLLKDLFRSFLTAFAVVAIVMVFVLRSFVGGLVAMIPNLFPTIALFGCMGLWSKPLDIGSVMSASVALGIAVDDTIHLLSRFGSRRAQGLGQIRAAHGALSQCGWAMLQTTMVCGLSLMVYWFSGFVPTSQFALLMFGLLSAALFGDVFLLPSLMASPLGKYLAHTVGSDPNAQLEKTDSTNPVDARRVRTGQSQPNA